MTDEEKTQRETILQRVERLLALSTSSNEFEAAQAAAKAHELLLKHNMRLEEVIGKKAASEVVRERFSLSATESEKWYEYLANGTAKFNHCQILFSRLGGWKKAYTYYGRRDNIAIARETTQWISHALQVMHKTAARDYGFRRTSDDGYWNWRTNFLIAASSAVTRRLRDVRAQEMGEATEADSKALVVSMDAEVQKYIDAFATVGGRRFDTIRKLTARGVAPAMEYNCRSPGQSRVQDGGCVWLDNY